MQLPFYRRLLSYLYPVKIRTAPGSTTPLLHLFLFQGRWQLASATALYSDGNHYQPLRAAFGQLKPTLQQSKNILVLGAGLGSAVYILDRLHYKIPVTLVDLDQTVIDWGKELMPERLRARTQWIQADVREFVLTQEYTYDIIIVDIFEDRTVPFFVTSENFLRHCHALLGGADSVLVLNYIVNNPDTWKTVQAGIAKLFRIVSIIDLGINQVVIAQQSE